MSDSEMAAPMESAEEQEQKRLKLNAVNKAKAESVQKEFEGRFLSSSLSTTQVGFLPFVSSFLVLARGVQAQKFPTCFLQMFLGDYGKATPIHVPSRTVLLSTKVAGGFNHV